jgi:uncharacterized protein YqhQ
MPVMTPRRPRTRIRWRDIILTAAINAASAPPAPFFYGGQAVIEGVLMRGKRHFAVAARKPDGSITIFSEMLRSRVYTGRIWSLPFFRGVAGLYEMLNLGMRALQWSLQVQLGEEAVLSTGTMRATMSIGVIFGLILFIGLPLLVSTLVQHGARSLSAILVEGLARAVILFLYLFLIGRVGNVRRVFEYHGAEHKAINCLESGGPVDVAAVRRSSRLHPRCGTGFLVVVLFLTIIVFAPLGGLFPPLRILIQIALVPVVAGIAYEAIRGLAKVRRTLLGRVLLAPILATQRLTTREPDDRQMEVAIAALAAARAGEEGVGESHDPTIA